MPLTVRDMKTGTPPVQRNIASLAGGFVIGIGCFVLWMLVASQLTGGTPSAGIIALGAIASIATGVWIRLADM